MDKDISKTWFVNGSTLAFTTVADVEALLKCLLLAATICYTLLKCWRLIKSKSQSDNTEIFTKGK